MNYSVFSDHIIGQAHVRMGMDCEDCSGHFCDGQGRYAVAVVCDGHSDPKCFRSAAGARMGCEAAMDILRRFMETYCQEDPAEALEQLLAGREETGARIRAAIVSDWNRRVEEDLRINPITEEEYAALDHPKYRAALELFRSGQARSTIYGATMLAAAVCEDFHVVMHIGDGIIVRLSGDGVYETPLPADDREEMEGPASLCDGDLLTRPQAFRVEIGAGRPQAIFATSDGIGDMPLSVGLREHLCKLQRELMARAEQPDPGQPLAELNQAQEKLLHSFIEYFSRSGLEDDCCLGGFYDRSQPVADVRLPGSELDRLYRDIRESREEEDRKYRESRQRLEAVKAQTDEKLERMEQELDRLQTQFGELDEAMRQTAARAEQVAASLEQLERRHAARSEDLRRQEQAVETRYGRPSAEEGAVGCGPDEDMSGGDLQPSEG